MSLRRMSSAKIHVKPLEDITPREKAIAYSQMTIWNLSFADDEDEHRYLRSLKNLFFFPTFWPIIIVFILFSFTQSGVVRQLSSGDGFLATSFAINMINFVMIFVYTLAQLTDFLNPYAPNIMLNISKKVLGTRLEDMIIILSSTAQGIYQLSLVSRDLCSGCATIFEVEKCSETTQRGFPVSQTFFAYVSLIMLPIYFKSVSRHVVLLSWAIVTGFVIATHIYGSYRLDGSIVLFVIFFLVSIWEFERYKMISFLLSKEALTYEQNKLFLMQEKSKIIERKLHLALVHQILPPKVAEQIIQGKQVVPELFEEVTIFFSDVVGFTTICSQVGPIEVVHMLNDLYTVMDYCTSLFPLYKVETIGDAYMLVGGLPVRDKDHAQHIANFALLVQRAVQAVKSPIDGSSINIRIGMHSGSVMAGVVGNLMPRYCLFGDTVNTASRMESNGIANQIHCSEKTANILKSTGLFELDCRGEIDIKGKGLMTTYWLTSATEKNEKSNNDAIARAELMVQEILDTSPDEDHKESSLFNSNENISVDNIDSTTNMPIRESFDDIPMIEETDDQDSLGPLSPTGTIRHANSKSSSLSSHSLSSNALGNSKVRHSIRYNIAHRLSDPGQIYDSTGAKILVVEDSTAQRKMMIQRLHQADSTWDITPAVSGEDALQKLKAAKLQFDVVFVDENLSINDGLYGHELVQIMRESFNMKTTVIIACTGNPKKNGDDLLSAGVDYVWAKPPPAPNVMKAKIDVLLNARIRAMGEENSPTK